MTPPTGTDMPGRSIDELRDKLLGGRYRLEQPVDRGRAASCGVRTTNLWNVGSRSRFSLMRSSVIGRGRVGFDPQQHTKGHRLPGMRERISLARGMLTIESGKRGRTMHALITAAPARDHGRDEGFSRRPNAARGSLRIVRPLGSAASAHRQDMSR